MQHWLAAPCADSLTGCFVPEMPTTQLHDVIQTYACHAQGKSCRLTFSTRLSSWQLGVMLSTVRFLSGSIRMQHVFPKLVCLDCRQHQRVRIFDFQEKFRWTRLRSSWPLSC